MSLWCFSVLFAVFTVLIMKRINSCSLEVPNGAWINGISPLSNSNFILLDIQVALGTDWYSNSYTLMLDISNGETFDYDGSGYDIVSWSNSTVDMTHTHVQEIYVSNNRTHVRLNRNGETFSIALDFNSTDDVYNISDMNTLYFKYWTLPSILTTFVALTKTYSGLNLFSITFGNATNNDIFIVREGNMNVNDDEFDMLIDMTSDDNISVFEDYNYMEMPLTCCLCSNSFIAKYNISANNGMNENGYDLSLSDSIFGAVIDTRMGYAFTSSHYMLTVYDLSTGVEIEWMPDISKSVNGINRFGVLYWEIISFMSILYSVL